MDVHLENDVLRVEGRVDFGNYEGLEPLYTEYNIGHFARAFTLSSKIDQQQISAKVEDGVLTLTLKKAREAMPRRINIS
jgi:HSP20 family molecular chaperone IbpA